MVHHRNLHRWYTLKMVRFTCSPLGFGSPWTSPGLHLRHHFFRVSQAGIWGNRTWTSSYGQRPIPRSEQSENRWNIWEELWKMEVFIICRYMKMEIIDSLSRCGEAPDWSRMFNGDMSDVTKMDHGCLCINNGKSETYHTWLVVWTPLKNMKVNWDDYSQYMGK